MTASKSSILKAGRARARKQRGVALITTLLLLLLVTAMIVAMVMTAYSDMMVNGFYRNFRGSFYAADSGLNVARQAMMNQFGALAPGVAFNPAVAPLPVNASTQVQNFMVNTYGTGAPAPTALAGTGSAQPDSWPGKFRISQVAVTDGNPVCTVISTGGGTCAAPLGAVTGYSYRFNYNITVVGQAQGAQATTLTETGTITANTSAPLAPNVVNFAAWGMFIDQFPICSGTLVQGEISGPVFTNDAWTYGTGNIGYHYTDIVRSVSPNFGYSLPNGCKQSNAASASGGGSTIAPKFDSGFALGQQKIPLPANDFDQKRAVLDGLGAPTGKPVPDADMNQALADINGNKWGGPPTAIVPPKTGVFLPYDPATNTFTGGGIDVEGNADVKLSVAGASQQIFTITQGGTVTTVTVDNAANTTTMSSGGKTVTITGVPRDKNANKPGAMLYVNGSVTSLAGPAGQPAIQDASAVTITANGSITITGDLKYKTQPINMPADTINVPNDSGQTLGLFTTKGDIILNSAAKAGSNLEIDATIAAITANGGGGLVNNGNAIGTLTIVGG
ncbi:MAG TPA: hypothetical protein VEW69_01150, partial [Alphaproteobacteria bacterium]|nr:hypothetical protein [Alphaproteobacteria bacterium]